MAHNIAHRELERLSDPARQQADLNRRLALANPQLQGILAGVRSDLNLRGFTSASPLSRATTQAGTRFASGISQDFFAGLEQRRTGLIGILAQIEQAEKDRKTRERSSLFGGIGGLIGTGLSFIPGLNQASQINRLIQLMSGGGGGNTGLDSFNIDTGFEVA